jgi:hypothetical protein
MNVSNFQSTYVWGFVSLERWMTIGSMPLMVSEYSTSFGGGALASGSGGGAVLNTNASILMANLERYASKVV